MAKKNHRLYSKSMKFCFLSNLKDEYEAGIQRLNEVDEFLNT